MNSRRFLSILLTLAMFITACVSTLSFVAFAIGETIEEVVVSKPMSNAAQTDLIMNVGSDESERNFVWFHPLNTGSLEIAVRNGNTFPTEYKSIATSIEFSTVANAYIHRAYVYGLEPETEYVYRLKNGSVVSKNYYFKTAATDHFSFAFAGDPQIGAYGVNHIGNDGSNWAKAVDFVKNKFSDTTLFLTAGDQVNNGNNETQYDAFLAPANLPSFAFATTIGNHETSYYNMADYSGGPGIYQAHYNLPNNLTDGTAYNKTETGSNYWYTYNNVLFMHLNSNSLSYAEHEAFMKAAIAANPNVTWKVVVMHYGLFGAWYFESDSIIQRRNGLATVFDSLDIDVVLNGHEHVYARSYMIENGTTAKITTPTQASVTDPKGILYITASSSSGSKYYELLDDAKIPHVAVKYKNNQTVSHVEVDKDSFKITTYNVQSGATLDTFEIVKTNTASMPGTTNIALGKTYETSEQYKVDGAIKYPDETGKTMTDGVSAPSDALYKHEAFIALYKTTDFYTQNGYAQLTLDLGKSYDLGRLVARVGTVKCTSGVNAPTKLDIYVSSDKTNWKFAGSTTVNDNSEVSCIPINVILDTKATGRYVQYRFTIDNGVFAMVSEVEAYEWHEHVLGDWKTVLEPTYETDGLKHKHCSKCGMTVEHERILSFANDPANKNLALGRQYTTTAPNRGDGKYDDDGIRLTDGSKGNADGGGKATDGTRYYSGWNHDSKPNPNVVEILLDLQSIEYTDTYKIYLAGGTWGIKLPTSVSLDVYVSTTQDSGYVLAASAAAGSAVLTNGTGVYDDGWSTYTITANAEFAKMARFIKLVITNSVEEGGYVWMDEFEVLMLNEVVKDPDHVHNDGEWIVVKDAKVGVDGSKELRCTDCGEVLDSETIPAIAPDKSNLAYGKTYTNSDLYTTGGNIPYPDENGVTMTDGAIAPTDALYNHAAYAGFNIGTDYNDRKYFYITVDLGDIYKLDKFIAYVASAYNSAAGIREPSEVQFWVSEDNETWVEAGNVYVVDDGTTSCIAAVLNLKEAVAGRYVQYRFKPKASWVMVAEVEAFGETIPDEPIIPEEIVYGDVNADKKVDSLDYLLVKRACFGTYTLSQEEYVRANVNRDDRIDST
ncbi:MAG: discoidin domain-containing protein, partial [Clostridia bacterium]|nr:discoidin domain-containing protein [Clostridia bacterium]